MRFPNCKKTPRSCHKTQAVYMFWTPYSATSKFSFIVLTSHSSLQLDYLTVYTEPCESVRTNSRPWAAATLLLTFVLNSRPMTSWLKQNIVTDTVLNAIKTSLWISVCGAVVIWAYILCSLGWCSIVSYYRSFHAACFFKWWTLIDLRLTLLGRSHLPYIKIVICDFFCG